MIRIHFARLLGEQKRRPADVVRDAGVSRRTVDKLWHEDVKHVDLEALSRICAYLKCEVGDLLEYVPDESSGNSPSD